MFVRNNTKCPECGKCSTFDVTLASREHPSHFDMRFECIRCGWAITVAGNASWLSTLLVGVTRHQGDALDFKELHRLYCDATRSFDSVDDMVLAEQALVKYWSHWILRGSCTNSELIDDQFLTKVVSYFLSNTDRKRKFRNSPLDGGHLLRLVGL